MQRKKVLIIANAQFNGLMASMGVELHKRGCDIVVSSLDPNVSVIMKRVFGDVPYAEEVLTTTVAGMDLSEDVVARSLACEKRLGVTFARLCSYDRALGKGYLNNVDRHPDIIRGWWPMEDKYREVLGNVTYWESVFEKHKPSLVLSFAHPPLPAAVADAHGVLMLSLASCRFKDYWFFADNPCYTSELMRKSMAESLDKGPSEEELDFEFGLDTRAALLLPGKRMTYKESFREALNIFIRDTVSLLRGTRRKNAYRYLGWLPSRFRKVWAQNYLVRRGKRPEDLKGYRKILVALHMEPEIALMVFSPEFTNCMEMVVRLSKSLPADTVLVVKEHPLCFGVRSRAYYDLLLRIPNVVLAHPDYTTDQWMGEVDAVSVISSTVGIEAVFAHKPVISFGRRQLINILPGVRYVEDLDSVERAVADILGGEVSEDDLALSCEAFTRGQLGAAFSVPGIADLTTVREYLPEQARLLVGHLMEQYGHVLEAEAADGAHGADKTPGAARRGG